MKAKITKCPNKNYWYSGMVGKIIDLTGEKWVDDGLHERAFKPGTDDGVPMSQVIYSTVIGGEVCATDIEILE